MTTNDNTATTTFRDMFCGYCAEYVETLLVNPDTDSECEECPLCHEDGGLFDSEGDWVEAMRYDDAERSWEMDREDF